MINIGEPGWNEVRQLTADSIRQQIDEGNMSREILFHVLAVFEELEDYEICTVIRDVLK